MAYGDKILAHPDKQEIIDRLLAGDSVKNCAAWLKAKYVHNRNRWISYLTLQRYRDEHLNLKGEVLKEIKQATRELTTERVHQQRTTALRESSAYETGKTAVITGILDQGTMLLELHDKIQARLAKIEAQDYNYKNEAVMVEYIGQFRQLIADYHKMTMDIQKFNSKSDTTTNVQVVIQQAQEQVNTLKKIIVKVLQRMDPNIIPEFLEMVRVEMEQATSNAGSPTVVNVQVNT